MSDSLIPQHFSGYVFLNPEGQESWDFWIRMNFPSIGQALPGDLYKVGSTDCTGAWLTNMRTGGMIWLANNKMIQAEQNAATGEWEEVQ